ncbi:class F sortase [Pedobacter sp.]|uniref:class F sortase n=1 Tax=Pedobacter sp. TaxID=1411316 RepID=UPI003D7F6C64
MTIKRQIIRRWLIGLSLVVAIALLYIVLSNRPQSTSSTSEVRRQQDTVSVSHSQQLPDRLEIPKINVESVILGLGVNESGDMDAPTNIKETGWYKYGPKPGAKGTAVIAGHYGWKNGDAAIFNDLNQLVEGDKVVITDKSGRKSTFSVTKTAIFDPNQDATEVFTSTDGKSHLNLITCQGTWNNTQNTYSERLVVFTDRDD